MSNVTPGNMAQSDFRMNRNCPFQSYDCSEDAAETMYGKKAYLIDATPSYKAQTYPLLHRAFAPPFAGNLNDSLVCGSCAHLTDPGCIPPDQYERRIAYDECSCAVESRIVLPEDTALREVNEAGWIVYQPPNSALSSSHALSRLMAFPRSFNELCLFNLSEAVHSKDFVQQKQFHLADMESIGFMFHSSRSGYARWTGPSSACGKLNTIRNLQRTLSMRWIRMDPPPFVYDPTSTLVPQQVTVVIRQKSSKKAWVETAITSYESNPLVNTILLRGSYSGRAGKVQSLSNFDFAEIVKHVPTEAVLLIDSSVQVHQVLA